MATVTSDADPGIAAAAADARLAAWCQVAARGDEAAFARRLAWDRLDRATAIATLAPSTTATSSAGAASAWSDMCRDAYASTGPVDPWADLAGDRAVDARQALPFEELLLPLVRCARRQVFAAASPGDRPGDDEIANGAQATFERALLRQLCHLCARALYAAFTVFRSQRQNALLMGLAGWSGAGDGGGRRALYDQFVRDMRERRLPGFFREYAVLARLCATAVEQWRETVIEFLARLRADRPALEERFGQGGRLGAVTAVETGLGDAHQGGRAVIIVTFASGVKLVYKPRPIALEACFTELAQWVNASGGWLPLGRLAVLSRPTHGWVEFVPHQPCRDAGEVARFYQRCGMLLALVYAINGSDFHVENLIASGEHPVLIDMEALLGHRFELMAHGGEPASVVEETVLRVHLLPFFKIAADGQAADAGGLAAQAASEDRVRVPVWTRVNTDLMRIANGEVTAPFQGKNLPVLDGASVPALGHLDDVLAGFRHTYALLAERRDDLLAAGGWLDRLGGQPVRFIFRHTSLYGALLERALHPRFLRDAADRSVELDVLAQPLLDLEARPVVWPILRAERAALEQLDVPFFATRADSRRLELSTGEVIEDCFRASAVDEVRRRLESLNDGDRTHQEDVIRAAFAANAARDLHAMGTTGEAGVEADGLARDERIAPIASDADVRARARSEASRLADVLIARARAIDQMPAWIGPAYLPAVRRYTTGPLKPSLFDGSAGIAAALAAVSVVTGRDDCAGIARATLLPLGHSLRDTERSLVRGAIDPGIGTGLASSIYALTLAADLLGADGPGADLLEAATDLAGLLRPDVVPVAAPDLLAGDAGAVLGLVALFEATGDRALLTRAGGWVERLLERRVEQPVTGRRLWPSARGVVETGLAHGQSGIAYALLRHCAHVDDAACRGAANEAFGHERDLLATRKDAASGDEQGAAWSYGAAGSGLACARILMSSPHGHPNLRGDLEAAVARTRVHLFDGPDDICGGTLGRVELLIAAAQVLDRPALFTEALAAMDAMLTRAARRDGRYRSGWTGGYDHLGLFQGLAGVASTCARIADPARVRSVACWA